MSNCLGGCKKMAQKKERNKGPERSLRREMKDKEFIFLFCHFYFFQFAIIPCPL
jgi:hypothetical protein